MSEKADTGLKLAFGSYEDAVKMIGTKGGVSFGDIDVNAPMIRYYAAMLEDANPSYWDPGFAEEHWGGEVSPPGMLMTWSMRIPWSPHPAEDEEALMTKVPLPGDTVINVETETEFFRPVYVGDRLNSTDELVDISPEKTTRLGTGHFITTLATFRNQRGEIVGTNRNVLFRFSAGGAA